MQNKPKDSHTEGVSWTEGGGSVVLAVMGSMRIKHISWEDALACIYSPPPLPPSPPPCQAWVMARVWRADTRWSTRRVYSAYCWPTARVRPDRRTPLFCRTTVCWENKGLAWACGFLHPSPFWKTPFLSAKASGWMLTVSRTCRADLKVNNSGPCSAGHAEVPYSLTKGLLFFTGSCFPSLPLWSVWRLEFCQTLPVCGRPCFP